MYELTEFLPETRDVLSIDPLNILGDWNPSTVQYSTSRYICRAVHLLALPERPSGRGAPGPGTLARGVVLLAVMFNCSPPPKATLLPTEPLSPIVSRPRGSRLPDPHWSTPLAGRAHTAAPLGSRSCASFHPDAIITLPHTYRMQWHRTLLMKGNFSCCLLY